MELQTDAMATDVTDNFIALALGKFIDYRADFALTLFQIGRASCRERV